MGSVGPCVNIQDGVCTSVPCDVHVYNCLHCLDGGIAALTAPERFCQQCRQDFSKEHECYEIEDDPEGITEAKEQSGTPVSEEMVVP